MLFGLCLSPWDGAFQQPPWVGKAKWGLGITKAASTQGAKMLKKTEMWKFEVDILHVISLRGICQFLSYMWDGGREIKQKAASMRLKS